MHYDAIYISPHLDDVALSCGGQIAQQTAAGAKILIVTVMAGDPPDVKLSDYAQSLHNRWELDWDAVAHRREEDIAACEILGAEHLHWRYPDCIYRRSPMSHYLYTSDEDIFGAIHASDHRLVEAIKSRLSALPPAHSLLAPLGVGNHIDHQLTLAAVRDLPQERVKYYADYPYAQVESAVTTAINKLSQVDGSKWQVEIVSISQAALARKCEAIAAYSSQLGTFFRDRADLEIKVSQYAQAVGGEQLWRPT